MHATSLLAYLAFTVMAALTAGSMLLHDAGVKHTLSDSTSGDIVFKPVQPLWLQGHGLCMTQLQYPGSATEALCTGMSSATQSVGMAYP